MRKSSISIEVSCGAESIPDEVSDEKRAYAMDVLKILGSCFLFKIHKENYTWNVIALKQIAIGKTPEKQRKHAC